MDFNLVGKKHWNSEGLKKEIIEEFKKQYPEIKDIDYSAETKIVLGEISQKYNNLLYEIVANKYRQAVIDEKIFWFLYNQVKEQIAFELVMRTGDPNAFDRLTSSEQWNLVVDGIKTYDQKTISSMALAIKNEASVIADKTVNKIRELQETNKFINGYNSSSVLLGIASNIPQQEYLSADLMDGWKKEFDVDGKSDDDVINVYVFQNGGLGAANYMKFGSIGAPDGMFCISEKRYNKIIAGNAFDDGTPPKCINPEQLSFDLGNVPIGIHPIAIKISIKVKDLRASMGGMSTAYFGEFCPGLKTQGGVHEACTSQVQLEASNYEIISHSPYMTTEQILAVSENVRTLLNLLKEDKSIQDFYGLDTDSKTLSQIADDSALLDVFKASLLDEERKVVDILLTTDKKHAEELFDETTLLSRSSRR